MAKRGRPRKNPLPPLGDGAGEVAAAVEAGSVVHSPSPAPWHETAGADGLPPRVVNGQPNPAHYREKYALVNKIMLTALREGGSIPFNFDSAIKGIDAEARAAGFDPMILKDTRSKEQIVADAIARLAEAPSSVWELLDEEIEAIEKAMDKADQMCIDVINDVLSEESTLGKALRSRLARVRRLRDRARNPQPSRPKGSFRLDPEEKDGIEAAWVLRLMLYAGRSNMPELANGPPAKSVYMIGKHHAHMAVAYWEAAHGVAMAVPPDAPSGLAECIKGAIPYKGCFLLCPPGHGKTEMGRFIMASRIAENPKRQLILNHAQSEQAQKNLVYLRGLFELDNPDGRRFHALFGLELAQGNAKFFKLKINTKLRQPTASAAGVRGKINGSNASDQWWDDPVDQKEAEQETERKRTFALLNGTWLTRMRGDGFVLATFTPWHQDDAMMRYVGLVHSGKAAYRVKKQAAGGPKDPQPFKPVWPEMYPARKLREIYDRMKSPSLYAAAYMMNPKPDELRIVRKLRLYDPLTEEHNRFLENSVKYLSLDPAATRGERSDKAGVLYAGFGSVQVVRDEDGRTIYGTEKRVRILDCDAITATQGDLVNHTINICRTRPVDYVMVETRGGYHATAEMFENYHGVDVRRLDPKNKSKEERLRAAAPAIDDGNADMGFRAVVEFPGVRNEHGQLVLNDRFRQLAEEILDFGACATDHMLDALTQLLIDLSPDLGIGTGGQISNKIVQADRACGDHRLAALLKQFEKPSAPKSVLHEENEWIVNNWNRSQKERWA